ncbi:MAG: ribosome silencing factor [Ignavibacteria bacterium]
MESIELAYKVSELIFDKKGYDVKILDLRTISGIADYFVICSADSDTHVRAISDEVDKELRNEGIKAHGKEGLKGLNWALMDYFDVIVHIFKKDVRANYNLEKLWSDAPAIIVEDKSLMKQTR